MSFLSNGSFSALTTSPLLQTTPPALPVNKRFSARRNSVSTAAFPEQLLSARVDAPKKQSIGNLLSQQKERKRKDTSLLQKAPTPTPPPPSVSPVFGGEPVSMSMSMDRDRDRDCAEESFGRRSQRTQRSLFDDEPAHTVPININSSSCSEGAYYSAHPTSMGSLVSILRSPPSGTLRANRTLSDPNESNISTYSEDTMSDVFPTPYDSSLPRYSTDFKDQMVHNVSLIPGSVIVTSVLSEMDGVPYTVKQYTRRAGTPAFVLEDARIPADVVHDCARELELYSNTTSYRIPRYKGCWSDPDHFCIKLEATEAVDFAAVTLTSQELLTLALHIGEALEEAHQHKVCHGAVTLSQFHQGRQKKRTWKLAGWETCTPYTERGALQDVMQLGECLELLVPKVARIDPSLRTFISDMRTCGSQRKMEARDVVQIVASMQV